MAKINCNRKGCKDVFNSCLVKHAEFSGIYEFPKLKLCDEEPKDLVVFSKSLKAENLDCWVHTYEDDWQFERLWNNPEFYLPTLQKYAGVITPDFSLYRDMPFAMQVWNIYRSRAIGSWLQSKGLNVIPNIRFGDERTFELCCEGIEKGGTIAIGTHGCIKDKSDREYIKKGLNFVVIRLEPKTIIVYGAAPDDIFKPYRDAGIKIIQFDSDFAKTHKVVKS